MAQVEKRMASLKKDCKRVALITGVNGQDGSYLSELLLEKGYEVHGAIRPASILNTKRLKKVLDHKDFHVHEFDLIDKPSMITILSSIEPDEIYNLAAQPMVPVSVRLPEYTAQVTGVGVLKLTDAIKELKMQDKVRIYQAATSELFGQAPVSPQNEKTPFAPRSLYGVSKLFAYWSVVNYREGNPGAFAVNGITFNHESPRRGDQYVTKKITRSVARIHLGLQEKLELGNVDSKRDWGHARDYVECMWRILQLDQPSDFVIATGELHSVREFVEAAFRHVGRDLEWEGAGVDEVGVERKTGVVRVRVNPAFYRPIEANTMLGDFSKVKKATGWSPNTDFTNLVKDMMEGDLDEQAANKED